MNQETCLRCDKPIKPGRGIEVELNCRTLEVDFDGTSSWSNGPDSQGIFVVGADCARILRQTGSLTVGAKP